MTSGREGVVGLALAGALVVAGIMPAHAATPSPPPLMTFTPNARADAAEGAATGQNEPVVAVDQTGLTYITWQGAKRPGNSGATNTVATSDGRSFTELGVTDTGSQGGDVTLATTSWPAPSSDLAAPAAGVNGVFWGDLGSNTCGPLGFRAASSGDRGKTWYGAGRRLPAGADRP